MIGRPFANSTAVGAGLPARIRRCLPAWALVVPPAFLQPHPFAPAVDAAGRAFNSATFWLVLAFLLSIGCLYYLIRWLYERRILQQQENLNPLYSLSESILESHDTATVYKEIAEVARLVAGGTHCYVLLLDSAAQQLEYEAGTDLPPLSAVSLSAISGAVTCFRSQTLTEVPDAEDCPFVKSDVVRRLGQKALLYVPIIAGGACLGVIEVEDRSRKRIFSRQEKTRVRHVARLAALGLRLGDQRTLETNLHRTEKMSAVSELIEAVAETLVTPLKRLDELAQSATTDNGSGVASRLKEVARESRRTLATVEQLANLANSRRGHPREVDLHQLLHEVQERLIEDGRTLHLNLSSEPARIVADPQHLEQVLLSLLQHGEQLLEGIGADSLQVSTNLLERNVIISIAPPDDAQRGDPEPRVAAAERLLEPESSLRLAVCQNLVEGFGGRLQVENRARRGFRIELRYPLAADTLRRKSAAPRGSSNGVSTGVMTSLIIDPDAAVQDALLFMLSERGYRAIPVATPEEGLDLCQQAQFDCVFCDARLMGGATEIYERIRTRVSKFIFLAEKSFALDAADLPGRDCAVLYKPVDPADLGRMLEPLAPEPTKPVEEPEKQTAGAG